jgi:2-keto-4-pentenoate hydratase
MTGSLHAAFPVSQGDLVEAEFDRLGRVGVRFEGGSG